MKKIWILVGAVLLFVFLLFSFVFIGGFGDFAFNLGDKSQDIQNTSKYDFVGTWKTTNLTEKNLIGIGGTYSFSLTGKGTFGGLIGNWKKENDTLIVNCEEIEIIYEYTFLDGKNFLILSNENGILEFNKNK